MGERILHKDGYAQQIKKYEASGNMIEVSYFGIYGEPIQNIQGYARRTHTYNARVQIIEDAFFGVQGKAVFNRQGWHKSVNFFDDRGHNAGYTFYGSDQRLKLAAFSHSAIICIQSRFDAKPLSVRHYNAEEKPTIAKQVYHARIMLYNYKGQEIE